MKLLDPITFSDLQVIAIAGSNECSLERKGSGFTLFSHKTRVKGEFNTLEDVMEALDNDPNFV